MTKKDYELIARAIAGYWFTDPYYENAAARDLVTALADALAADNPRFDRQRFLNAALGVRVHGQAS